ncbi:MAG TPA: hypothetical protein VK698_14780 [Kofleriaceae bacterium]|nr:hypothetical protein [Kofleriaceae bacterium]
MTRTPSPPTALAVALVALAASGCLDPLVGDEVGASGLILPAGTPVESAHDDPAIERQIDQSDGVDDVVARVHGFAGGAPIAYWDFGPAPTAAVPLFVLVREGEGGELEPIDHPSIIGAIPGDAGYSPFWSVLTVEVTGVYAGELLTSFAAVQEAERVGLVEAPVLSGQAIHCPVVASDVTVEVGDDGEALAASSRFFWEGLTVDCFDFGSMPVEAGSRAPDDRRYQIRRDGSEPLSEVVRGIDLTGDGDLDDSNDVFSRGAADGEYSPLCRTVAVAVADDTAAIDTFADQTMSAIRAATDLFDPEAIEGIVVAVEITDDLRDCPQQREPGGL